jgi:predicted transcriptional regulator
VSQKPRTKDELFILCLYEEAQKTGNPQNPVNRYEVGKRAGLQFRAVDTICKLLLQANFIKKEGEVDIYLTKNGEDLVHRLLAE